MKLRKGVPFFTCISLPEQGSIFPKIGCDSLSGLNQGLTVSIRCFRMLIKYMYLTNAPGS